jgi:hypothetical protein
MLWSLLRNHGAFSYQLPSFLITVSPSKLNSAPVSPVRYASDNRVDPVVEFRLMTAGRPELCPFPLKIYCSLPVTTNSTHFV